MIVGFIAYLSLFILANVLIVILATIALRNIKLKIFKTLGKEYIVIMTIVSTLMNLANIASGIYLLINPNNLATITHITNILIGIQMWLSAMMFSTMISRQFMLAKIFGTLNYKGMRAIRSSKNVFWYPLILSSIVWVPIIAVYVLETKNIIGIIPFIVLVLVYYLSYISFFIFLAYKNKTIDKRFSDYIVNIVITVLILILVITDSVIFETADYGVIDLQLFIMFTFMPVFVIPPFATLSRRVIIFIFLKDELKAWEDYNFIFDSNSVNNAHTAKHEMSTDNPSFILADPETLDSLKQ
jgi:hypothetical protein